MRRPTQEQMQIAALWLDCNDAGDDEQAACEAVSVWLQQMVADQGLRAHAKRLGVPMSTIRGALKRAQVSA